MTDPRIQVALLNGDHDLREDTPLYKYLSIKSFMDLIKFGRLSISRMISWSDKYEGVRFEYLQQFREKYPDFSGIKKDDFFGSCWTLQTEDACLHENHKEHRFALDDLQKDGSASMWEAYCNSGGVRIKTTIGKIDALLETICDKFIIFRGKVNYEASAIWKKIANSDPLVSTLFVKRIPYLPKLRKAFTSEDS
jgi:hypothetical protein